MNRFRQPSPEVLARYRERGAQVLRTDRQGPIRVILPADGGTPVWASPLETGPRYWSDRRTPE